MVCHNIFVSRSHTADFIEVQVEEVREVERGQGDQQVTRWHVILFLQAWGEFQAVIEGSADPDSKVNEMVKLSRVRKLEGNLWRKLVRNP